MPGFGQGSPGEAVAQPAPSFSCSRPRILLESPYFFDCRDRLAALPCRRGLGHAPRTSGYIAHVGHVHVRSALSWRGLLMQRILLLALALGLLAGCGSGKTNPRKVVEEPTPGKSKG